MVTDKQRRVVDALARREISRYPVEPSTAHEMAALRRLIYFGIDVLVATKPDSWEMNTVEDGNAR